MITLAVLATFTLLCLLLGWSHAWSRETSPERNEIVFANRNQQYGAFRLRQGYDQRLAHAFLIALGSVFALMAALVLWARAGTQIIADNPRHVAVDVDLDRIYFPPPLPPAEQHKAATTAVPPRKDPLEALVLNAVDSMVEPPKLLVDTATLATSATGQGVGTGAGKDDSTGTPGAGNGTGAALGNATWENFEVQELPEFPGGSVALGTWVRKHLEFPPDAEGRDMVYVQFVVDKDGSVVDVKAVKGGQQTNRLAAERTVRRMPKWKPARMNGHEVRCRLTLPIKFETR
ncbi:MAG: energy transducer TonB [Bacteroidetes bacterium]|nr:energy transducer TonB [Bacteroidota bacterium]MBS1940843.1 energy transducer TonB [Bacteroidota bacterium]